MNLSLLNRCELAEPQPFDGRGEVAFAWVGSGLWFLALFLRFGLSDQHWTLAEKLVQCSAFVGCSGLPIFFLATASGAKFTQSVLLKLDGLWFQAIACFVLALYIIPVNSLNWDPNKFSWLRPLREVMTGNSFEVNAIAFLFAVFLALRLPFLFLKLRDQPPLLKNSSGLIKLLSHDLETTGLLTANLIACSVMIPSGYWVGLAYIVLFIGMNLPISRQASSQRLQIFDLLLIITCLGSMILFSSLHFDFAPFISVHLFVVVVMYGTGLGREHFGYSFQVRKSDVLYYLKMSAIACGILIPLALLLRFNRSFTGFPTAVEVFIYFILFSFRVGVMEEILFRSGLMVLVRDYLQQWGKAPQRPTQLVMAAAVITAIVFGICHVGNDPRDGSVLTAVEFKAVYIFLGSLAATFYGMVFGETNRLWCPVFLHGLVDTTAVLFLKIPLTAPF